MSGNRPKTHSGMASNVKNSTAKAVAADRSAQVVTATANLMRLVRESSHSEIVSQLPKDLAARLPNVRSTGKLLEQMPAVIVALDMHLDNALKSASALEKVHSLLTQAPAESSSGERSPARDEQEDPNIA